MFSFSQILLEKKRPLVMGILNITPDSFLDGGENNCLSSALERLVLLQEQGADIIDIGACSTAPCNELASCEEELSRLKSVLPELMRVAKVPVSIDTFRAEIAEYALSQGVSVVNDESGCFNDAMASAVERYGAGWIFMHTGGSDSRSSVRYENGVVADVKCFFADARKRALYNSISVEQLAFDVGIGFGKTRIDDLQLLNSLSMLSEYQPLLVGVSAKRVVGEATGRDKKERQFGSVAAGAVAIYNGAQILRVHDVAGTLDAIKMTVAIKKESL